MSNGRQRRKKQQALHPWSRGQGGGIAPTRQDDALERQAIANSWLPAMAGDKLAKVLARQIAIATDPKSTSRQASIAAGVVVKAVGQVMQQEVRDQELSSGVDVNVEINQADLPSGYVIIQREDFYGNNAHELQRQRAALSAMADGASAAAPADSGMVQDADLRTPVRENGHGDNGPR